MRSLQMESALIEFLEDAARHLQTDVECGSEVPIEIEQRGAGSRSPLFCYRPLTSEFMGSRWRALSGLSSYSRAIAALESFDGLERYVSSGTAVRGGARARTSKAQVALWTLLEDVFGEQTDFTLRRERLIAALDRMEEAAFAGATADCSAVATLHGMTITSPEIALAGGLRVVRPEALAEAPDSVLPLGPTDAVDHLLIAYACDATSTESAEPQIRAVIRQLLWALRLFGDGRVCLGGVGWLRMSGGRWQPMSFGSGGHPHGMLVVTEQQEDELRAFCNLVTRRAPRGNALAWALNRFQLGCDRQDEMEELSDHLLALRALLAPAGGSDGVLAGRLAALCAPPDQRARLAAEVVETIALEREWTAGRRDPDRAAMTLVRTLSGHLRAILRDVICGHLDANLTLLADGLLAESGDLVELSRPGRARMTPRPRRTPVRFRRADEGAQTPEAGQGAASAPPFQEFETEL